MLLESQCHDASVFVTLTYEQEPAGRTLVLRDLQLFLKRLRERLGPFRYYAVGEYGERSQRPHYHALLFGVSVFDQNPIYLAWQNGFVQVSDFTAERALYVSKYITKFDTRQLGERLKPFAVMSRRPAIGSGAVDGALSRVVTSVGGACHVARTADVPNQFRQDGKLYPLGRTLTKRLREKTGYESEEAKSVRQERQKLEAYAERLRVGVVALEVKRQASAASLEARAAVKRSAKL